MKTRTDHSFACSRHWRSLPAQVSLCSPLGIASSCSFSSCLTSVFLSTDLSYPGTLFGSCQNFVPFNNQAPNGSWWYCIQIPASFHFKGIVSAGEVSYYFEFKLSGLVVPLARGSGEAETGGLLEPWSAKSSWAT